MGIALVQQVNHTQFLLLLDFTLLLFKLSEAK